MVSTPWLQIVLIWSMINVSTAIRPGPTDGDVDKHKPTSRPSRRLGDFGNRKPDTLAGYPCRNDMLQRHLDSL